MSWNIRVRIPAEDYWGDLEGEALKGAVQTVEKAGDLAKARVQQLLVKSEGPAAPDEPPHSHTEALAKSVEREPAVTLSSRKGVQGVSTRVVVTDPGAARDEFGAIDARGIRTFPHPFLRPAFEDVAADIEALFREWARSA